MKKLGEILIEAGLITEAQFKMVLAEQKHGKKRLGEMIVSMGIASEIEIARALSGQLDYPFIELSKEDVDPEAVAIVDEAMAKQSVFFPFKIDDDSISIAMADPLSFSTIDDIRFKTGLKVLTFISTASDIFAAIEKHYHLIGSLDDLVMELGQPMQFQILASAEPARDVSELKKKGESPPIVKTVNSIISYAINSRASDIHIEPQKNLVVVRDRIDGMLRKVLELPKWVHQSVISRIKIMASLDISDKRRPQDGRIRVRTLNSEIDLRVSTLPSRFGETAVIRLLNSDDESKNVEEIGLSQDDLEKIKDVLKSPQGVILVTGPTGSGKSTTLYAFLQHLNNESVNIVTLEDPVEYEVGGITQVQINEKAGLSFASGLRSILRQDPDVVMVGEMRDTETAEIAMKASLTGHLVFSTLHTNDAVSTITRLVDMGVPHYLIASAVKAIVSQRLVRVICKSCKESYSPSDAELEELALPSGRKGKIKFYRGKGCSKCANTGYSGRLPIFEILVVDKNLSALIARAEPESSIECLVRKSGAHDLWSDGVEKIKSGLTTIEEVLRVAKRSEGASCVCLSCGKACTEEFHVCPYCGFKKDGLCPNCEKPVEPDWLYCPYCTAPIAEESVDEQGDW